VILLRHAEHRADDRERQIPAEFSHEVSIFPFLQSVEEPVGDVRDHRSQPFDHTALKRLVDAAAQAAMLRVIVAEHVPRQ